MSADLMNYQSFIRVRELVADRPGHRFEREVAGLFQNLGWEIQLTPVTGDLGADVVAKCLDELVVVQCKDWNANVGYDAVKEVVAARIRYKAKFAVVVSNAGYTKQARDNAPEMDVLLYRTRDLSVGSFLDRSEQGKRHRALKAFEKQEAERQDAHNRLVAEHMRYEKAIAHNLACEKAKAPRILKSLAALSTGIGVSIVSNHALAISLACLYVIAEWIGANRPEELPQKPSLPKPVGPFLRGSPPSFDTVPPLPISTPQEQPVPILPANNPPVAPSPLLNGFDKKVLPDGATYEGRFENGKLHGYGVFVSSNETYKGYFENNKKNGQGEIVWANGHRYVGTFKDDRITGRGEYVWPTGEKYSGDFVNSRRHGKGRTYFIDGQSYEGEYQNDKKHGYGTHILARGSKYIGEFVDDRYEGLGTFYSSDGKIQHEGVWKQGNFIKSQKIKIDQSELKFCLQEIREKSVELFHVYELVEFYDNLDKAILEHIFVKREEILSPELAYLLSKIYFAKICDRSSFFLKDYFESVDDFGFRTVFEDEPSEEDVLYELFWNEIVYLREYLLLSTPFGASFTICALLTLYLFRFDMRMDVAKLFEIMESPKYSNVSFISKLKHRLVMLKLAYQQAEEGNLSECRVYLDSLIKICDPDHSSLMKLSDDYERCNDPIIAACFLCFLSNKGEVSIHALGGVFRYFALVYNAHCNFIEYLFDRSSFNMEESIVSLYSDGIPNMIVEDHQPMLQALDPDLLGISVEEANLSTDHYVRYFCAFNCLYGISTDVDYEKARLGFEYVLTLRNKRNGGEFDSQLCTSARYQLSEIYRNGLGVPVDIDIAWGYFMPRG